MKAKKITGLIIGVVAVAVLAASSISFVPVGSTGVVVTMGKVQSGMLSEGIHFKAPFVTQIMSMNNQVQRLDVETEATSKDLQAISTGIALNFHLSGESSASMYQTVGKGYSDTLITPAIQEVVKNVMAQYSAEQLITNRSTVSIAISDELISKMSVYGIMIDDFNIVNFSFSAEFDAAIEAKQIAEQNKIKAQTEKEQRVIEAEAAGEEKTIAAQAEADAILLRAQAEAEAIRIKAEAEAEANKKLSSSLTGNVLEYNAIEKWNGEYPQVVSGSDTSMLIDINGSNNTSTYIPSDGE